MHEGSFTEQIVLSIMDSLKDVEDAKPHRVCVSVGEMLHLVPESVKMHYRVLTQGTPLENVELELKEVPVTVKCQDCSSEGPVEDHHLLMCQACDSRNVEILEGEDVTVDAIEMQGEC